MSFVAVNTQLLTLGCELHDVWLMSTAFMQVSCMPLLGSQVREMLSTWTTLHWCTWVGQWHCWFQTHGWVPFGKHIADLKKNIAGGKQYQIVPSKIQNAWDLRRIIGHLCVSLYLLHPTASSMYNAAPADSLTIVLQCRSQSRSHQSLLDSTHEGFHHRFAMNLLHTDKNTIEYPSCMNVCEEFRVQ